MKLWGIFRFEVVYQLRRVATGVGLAAFVGLATGVALVFVGNARRELFFVNAPIVIAGVTVMSSLFGLLVMAAVASDAATRDLHTRMTPLHYTVPLGKGAYLAGRFLGAFAVNLLLLLTAVPLGLCLAAQQPGLDSALTGPFRPAAYLLAFGFFALPNALVLTAVLFALAVLSRRALASYVGAALLFGLCIMGREFVADLLGRWTVGTLLDPTGFTGLSALWRSWNAYQKNTYLIGPGGPLGWNRLLWLGIAFGALGVAYLRFRFAHHVSGRARSRRALQKEVAPVRGAGSTEPGFPPIALDWSLASTAALARPSLTRVTRLRQLWAVALRSFRELLRSRAALVLPVAAVALVLAGPELLEGELGTPSLPTTGHLAALSGQLVMGLMVAVLTTLCAGQLVWQERDAGLSELTDAAPVPDWVVYGGKFLGLVLLLVALQTVVMGAGLLTQLLHGYHRLEVGLYLRLLFGLRLADYLLFAVVAMAGHVLVRDKYTGYLVVFLGYLYTVFAGQLGIGHHLLVFGSDPGWQYSEMNGLGAFLAPWLWFKAYWAAWAGLLGVVLMLFWVRGREPGLAWRLRLARRRLGRGLVAVAAGAALLVLLLGGFIFYNTNRLNRYQSDDAQAAQHARYERRLGRYRHAPQPTLTGVALRLELYPEQGRAQVRGTYRLVNQTGQAIDSVHVAFRPEVRVSSVRCDRPAQAVLADEEMNHHVLALYQPLQPGDTLRLHFEEAFGQRGFANNAGSPAVAANGTWITDEWLPAIGYQSGRELQNPSTRRHYGLPPRADAYALHDTTARYRLAGRERIAFEATIGTAADQTAVAPGTLRRTWAAGGRRYFRYATDAPIRNIYALFSARYAVHEARWNTVPIQIFYHPGHGQNLARLVRSARASLAYCTRNFGPYPLGQLKLVETPGTGNLRLTAYPGTIMFTENFALLAPQEEHRDLDLPFAVLAHEIAHQWWGQQLVPANVEGAPLLTESLAWYSALMVVEEANGPEHLGRLLRMMRHEYLRPRESAAVPLLRATNHFDVYRKGPFAMYALRQYLGPAPINAALRRLRRRHGPGHVPLPVSLDLYRELQAVAPDSLQPLLHDLFAANTFWNLKATAARAEPAGPGRWRVTLEINARKLTVDSLGAETAVPLHDFVEVGLYPQGTEFEPDQPIYLRRHRIRAGPQTIVVAVPARPASAGIDPRRLLIDRDIDDNLVDVTLGKPAPGAALAAHGSTPATARNP